MGFLDDAKNMLNEHDEQVDQGLDKAGEFAKGKFAGHDSEIDGLIDQAQQRTGEGDTSQVVVPPSAEAQPQP